MEGSVCNVLGKRIGETKDLRRRQLIDGDSCAMDTYGQFNTDISFRPSTIALLLGHAS